MSDKTDTLPKLASKSFGAPYECLKPWPADCFVQCGDLGVVLSKAGPYRTAFFEAFPDTFIRGEGATVAEAEASAWTQYQRQQACGVHTFERRGNSEHGLCTKCGHFKTKTFKPVHSCAICAKPEVNLDFYGRTLCLEHYLDLARSPETHSKSYDNESGLVTAAELAVFHRRAVWILDVLMEQELFPAGIADCEVNSYLDGKAFGFDLFVVTNNYFRGIYRTWLASHPDKPVGAMQFSSLVDELESNEDAFKTVLTAILIEQGLIDGAIPASIRLAMENRAFTLFEKASIEFAEVKARLSERP